MASENNLVQLEDPRAKSFSNLWFEQRFIKGNAREEYERRDKAAISYLRNIFGLDDDTINIFIGKTQSFHYPANAEKTVHDIREISGREFSVAQIEKIAFSYCENMLGLGRNSLIHLSEEHYKNKEINRAQRVVGSLQGYLSPGHGQPGKGDFASFWRDVAELWPTKYSEEDIQWLIARNETSAIHHMFSQWNYTSGVLQILYNNSWMYNR